MRYTQLLWLAIKQPFITHTVITHFTRLCRSAVPCVFLYTALAVLGGCIHSSVVPTPTPTITIKAPDDLRMRFSGKGAGAGMMMAASMGPMGIAIGVAIDEGIAKDIGNAAAQAGVNVPDIVKAEFEKVYAGTNANVLVELLEYGFVTKPGVEGVEDPVVASLRLRVNGSDTVLVSGELCDLQARELAVVKRDGVVVRDAIGESVGCLAENVYAAKQE